MALGGKFNIIKEIVKSHEANLIIKKEMVKSYYERNLKSSENTRTSERFRHAEESLKKAEESKKSQLAKEKMKNLLEEYIAKRASKLDERTNKTKDYLYDWLPHFFQKSFREKREAVAALKSALENKKVDLNDHLGTLKNGNLGEALTDFIQNGQADPIVGIKVRSISEFVYHLQLKTEGSKLLPSIE